MNVDAIDFESRKFYEHTRMKFFQSLMLISTSIMCLGMVRLFSFRHTPLHCTNRIYSRPFNTSYSNNFLSCASCISQLTVNGGKSDLYASAIKISPKDNDWHFSSTFLAETASVNGVKPQSLDQAQTLVDSYGFASFMWTLGFVLTAAIGVYINPKLFGTLKEKATLDSPLKTEHMEA